jgi:5-methylcytosine-specific restriction protein A
MYDSDEQYQQHLEQERRAQILARDKYTCQHCLACDPPSNGKPDYSWLQVHHIKPLSHGGTNDMDNLILLCHYCHTQEHKRLKKAEKPS